MLESGHNERWKSFRNWEYRRIIFTKFKNLQKLVGEDEIVLPKGGNIRIIFPKEISNESIITSMARNLDIDFSIVCGRLEKYREDILGSLIINVSSNNKEKVKKYLDETDVRWEVLQNKENKINNKELERA